MTTVTTSTDNCSANISLMLACLLARARLNPLGGNYEAVLNRLMREVDSLPAWLDHDAPYLEKPAELNAGATVVNTRISMFEQPAEPVKAAAASVKINTTASMAKAVD